MSDDQQRLKALKKILLDRKAPLAERDDAAIDLGEFDDPEALETLMEIAVDPQEDDIILASCGESIALIWLRTGKFDRNQLKRLVGSARVEAEVLLRNQRPKWLQE